MLVTLSFEGSENALRTGAKQPIVFDSRYRITSPALLELHPETGYFD